MRPEEWMVPAGNEHLDKISVFLNYRRKDSEGFIGRLSDHLRRLLPGIRFFRDIEAIPPGTDFTVEIDRRLKACDAMISLIGPRWLDTMGPKGRRIDDPEDWVRQELAAAFSRNVLVIPVLVGGAVMPSEVELPDELKPLSKLQAHELTERRWDYDVDGLAKRLLALPGLEVEQRLEILDREWELHEKRYQSVDKYGHDRPPPVIAVLMALFASIFGFIWAWETSTNMGSLWGDGSPLGILWPALGPVLAVAAIAYSIHELKRHWRFKRAQDAYQNRRAQLLSQRRG